MNISRRHLLGAAAALPFAGALASCSTLSNGITIAEADLAKATNITAGINYLLGLATNGKFVIPANIISDITTYAGQAEAALVGFAAGAVVPITSAQSFLTDANQFLTTAAPYLSAMPYFADVQAVVAALSLVWGGVVKLAATPGTPDVNTAMTRLSYLPRPLFKHPS